MASKFQVPSDVQSECPKETKGLISEQGVDEDDPLDSFMKDIDANATQ